MQKKPIAILMRNYTGVTPEALFRGMRTAAEEQDQPILVLNGGVLHQESAYIYDYLKSQDIGGLITWASTEEEEGETFYKTFANLPRLSLSVKLPDILSLAADSYAGMCDAVEHLIKEHGKSKILYIRGPEHHGYSQERYQGYLDTLKRYKIAINEDMISPPGSWEAARGSRELQNFINNRGLKVGQDFDALVCVNDDIALNAMDDLIKRGFNVPDDVAIIGYNNTLKAQVSTPPLTTVAMPFYEQGYEAMNKIVSMKGPSNVAYSIKLPATLSLGQSCGCLNQSFSLKKAEKTEETKSKSKKKAPTQTFDSEDKNLINKVTRQVAARYKNNELKAYLKETIPSLITAIKKDTEDQAYDQIMRYIREGIKGLLAKDYPIKILQAILKGIGDNIDMILLDKSKALWIDSIITKGQIFISEGELRENRRAALTHQDQIFQLQKVNSRLKTIFDEKMLRQQLSQDLPELGISEAYMVLGEQMYPLFGNGHPQKLNTNALYPEGWIGRANKDKYLIQPLILKEVKFGHMIYAVELNNNILYDTLTEQISSILYSINMVEENIGVKQRLQKVLEAMEQKIHVVSHNSSSINKNMQTSSTAMAGNVNSIKEIADNVENVLNIISTSVELIKDTDMEVSRLKSEADKIDEITAIITDIAENTKLLSFNASVEAARAGNEGKGFSVVAKEVKKLAFNTADSAADISHMIQTVQASTNKTTESVKSLRQIISEIADLSKLIKETLTTQSDSTHELSELISQAALGTGEIDTALEEIKQIGNSL